MGNKFIQDRFDRVIKMLGIHLKNFLGGDMVEILDDAKNLS
jgi:hypothetical protein